MLLDNLRGNYRFLTGIAPYSSGVVAIPGHEIIHVTLSRPIPCRRGFERIERFLDETGRSKHALCAVELRLPSPLSFDGFADFNGEYQQLLASWDMLLDGRNPVARTNIAPAQMPPAEPSLYAFAYTMPSADKEPTNDGASPTFVVAGAGDLNDQATLSPSAIIRPGETSAAALREKAAVVMQVMQTRLEGLGVDWSAETTVDIYTVHPLHPFLVDTVLDRIGEAANRGVNWHYARPPITGLAYEMDLRCVRREYTLSVDATHAAPSSL
jgi:hypothetical protein